MSPQKYVDMIQSLQPAAWYRLGEKSGTVAADSAGAHPGTIVGAPVPTNGLIRADGNGAQDFTAGGRVDITGPTLTAITSVTIMAWITLSGVSLTGMIHEVGSGGNGYGLGVGLGDATVAGNSLIGAYEGVRWIDSGKAMGTDRHHVALVIDAGGLPSLYLDGVIVASAVAGAGATTPTLRASIAARADGSGTRPFAGIVDEVIDFNAALTAAQIAAIFAASNATGAPVTVSCIWREPLPPHSALFSTSITAAKWMRRVRGMGTASMLVPKSDANAANVAKLLAKCVPMITLERSDGLMPFVGFPVDPRFKRSDTHGAFQLADHTMLLSQASTRIAAEVRQSSGQFIAAEVGAAIARGELLPIDLRQIPQVSPAASLALSGGTLEAMLRELEKQTGYEAFLTYAITPAAVVASLQWRAKQGKDRRTEDRWIDGEELADVQYNLNYRAGKSTVTSVGGTGSVPARASATATITASAVIGATTQVVTRVGRKGYGGAQVDFVPQVTDPQLLQARNVTILASPANAAVSWEAALVEAAVDMAKVDAGNVRRIATQDAFMGSAASSFARMISIELNADTGVHNTIWVEVA